MKKALFALLAGTMACHTAFAGLGLRDNDDPDAPKWAEDEIQLPAFPLDTNLREFYVSPTTPHKYFVDVSTLSIGKDGAVRYTLVVRTSGGALNVTYEGILCDRREFKIFATGHRDGTWAMARKPQWRLIEDKPVNRHHAALSHDFFCPSGVAIVTSEEGRDALRRGKHPDAN